MRAGLTIAAASRYSGANDARAGSRKTDRATHRCGDGH